MRGSFRNLYPRLKNALLRCRVFDSDAALRAVFADARIHPWYDGLPRTGDRERRVERTIAYLRDQYSADRENALVLLLQALSDRTDLEDTLHWILADLVHKVERALRSDGLNAFREALPNITFGDGVLIPLAGQVIAGTGDVAMTYINELIGGEMYLLEVIGTSMEYEGIFEGDHVVMRAFNEVEWPREGDMIVTKYLPSEIALDELTDVGDFELAGPTLKILHEKVDDQHYLLGWRKDNAPWEQAPWKKYHVPGNSQTILTRYIDPIGRVIDIRRVRRWDFFLPGGPVILE
jgi:hypothetical protein